MHSIVYYIMVSYNVSILILQMMDRQTLIIKLRPIKESEKIPIDWGGRK